MDHMIWFIIDKTRNSYLIYQTEHVSNIEDQMFESFGDALWWGICTLG